MKRKWTIFKEYYLVNTVIVMLLVAGLICFCYGRSNKKDCALQVIMMDVACSMELQEDFESQVGEIIGMDEQKEYVDISFCESPEMLLALMVNDEVDMFLMNDIYFEMILSHECLYPLDEVIGDQETVSFKGENGLIYGFSVSDNSWMEQFEFVSVDDLIISIVENGPNTDNACTLARKLLAR